MQSQSRIEGKGAQTYGSIGVITSSISRIHKRRAYQQQRGHDDSICWFTPCRSFTLYVHKHTRPRESSLLSVPPFNKVTTCGHRRRYLELQKHADLKPTKVKPRLPPPFHWSIWPPPLLVSTFTCARSPITARLNVWPSLTPKHFVSPRLTRTGTPFFSA